MKLDEKEREFFRNLGEIARKWRCETLTVSQRHLADLLGIGAIDVGRFERGEYLSRGTFAAYIFFGFPAAQAIDEAYKRTMKEAHKWHD